MNTDTHMNGSTVKNHSSLKTIFGYSVTHRTSFRSWFLVYQRSSSSLPSSTPMTPSKHEIDHPTSSSSSSTSPPMISSTVSSESVARQELGDPCRKDSYPAIVSSKDVEKQERGDLFSSGTPEEQLLPSSQWKKWISKQSPICSRGAGLGHSMDPVVSVKQKLHKKHKGACKSSWSQVGSLKSFTLNIP